MADAPEPVRLRLRRTRREVRPWRGARGERGGIMGLLLGSLVVLAAGAVLAWVFLLPGWLADVLQRETGCLITMQSLTVNPFTATAEGRGLSLRHPGILGGAELLQVREWKVETSWGALWAGQGTIDRMQADIVRLTLPKDKGRRRILAAWREEIEGTGRAGPASEGAATQRPVESGGAKAGKRREGSAPAARYWRIKALELRVERLVLIDDEGKKSEQPINFQRSYNDITSPVQIALPVLDHAASVGGTIGNWASQLGQEAAAKARQAGGAAQEAGRKAGSAAKDFWEELTGRR